MDPAREMEHRVRDVEEHAAGPLELRPLAIALEADREALPRGLVA